MLSAAQAINNFKNAIQNLDVQEIQYHYLDFFKIGYSVGFSVFGISLFYHFMVEIGGWKKYTLSKNHSPSLHDLYIQMRSACVNYFLLFPIVFSLFKKTMVITDQREIDGFYSQFYIRFPILIAAIIFGYIWNYIIHYYCHNNGFLYKLYHKKHHVLVNKMTPFSSWCDTFTEFIVFECFGFFILPFLIQPMPAGMITFIWGLISAQGINEHSSIYLHDWPIGKYIVDSRFHWQHHQNQLCNYAEMEFIDHIMGTFFEGTYQENLKSEADNKFKGHDDEFDYDTFDWIFDDNFKGRDDNFKRRNDSFDQQSA